MKPTLSYPYVENRSRKMQPYFGRPRNEAKAAELTVPETPEGLAEFIADPKNWEQLQKAEPQARLDWFAQ